MRSKLVKFSREAIGQGVTFNKLCKIRDSKGRVDYARKEIEGIITECDGYVCTVRDWDGKVHTNIETSEVTPWQEADKALDMPCLA